MRERVSRPRYEVITANNGFEALQVLRGAHPDIVASELNLPHMSGFELLAVIRKRFPAIAVIALSDEYTSATVPHETICDAFIPKVENINLNWWKKSISSLPNHPLGVPCRERKQHRCGYLVLQRATSY